MIGTGRNPNVAACVVIGIEPGWTSGSSTASRRPASPSRASAIEHTATSTPSPAPRARRRNSSSGRRSIQREECGIKELYISRASAARATRRRASRSARPSATSRQADRARHPRLLRRNVRADRRRARRAPSAPPRRSGEVHAMFEDYQEVVFDAEGRRPVREPADQGQHRRRPDDDRGEGARQRREARQSDEVHRRAPAGRGAGEGPGLYFMDTCSPRPRRDAVGGRRRRRPPVPDRPGQRDRQPDRAGHQDQRQPEDRRAR